MTNPFVGRTSSLSGPARDIAPITPDDVNDLQDVATALFIETGGALVLTTVQGQMRTVNVPDMCILPVGTLRVHASGTTASGIHALVV